MSEYRKYKRGWAWWSIREKEVWWPARRDEKIGMLRDAATPPTSQWHTCNDIIALVAYLHSWTAHTSDLSAVLGGVKWAPVAA